MTRVLIAGESWTTTSIHVKGFDSFTTVAYEEGVAALRDALLPKLLSGELRVPAA